MSLATDYTVVQNPAPACARTCMLSDLQDGQSARIVRVDMPDLGCRKRFAELGLAAGMMVTVNGTGDTLMLALGGGRMGLARRCAQCITVLRVDAPADH